MEIIPDPINSLPRNKTENSSSVIAYCILSNSMNRAIPFFYTILIHAKRITLRVRRDG